jgi:hypothetical protein
MMLLQGRAFKTGWLGSNAAVGRYFALERSPHSPPVKCHLAYWGRMRAILSCEMSLLAAFDPSHPLVKATN